MKLTQRSQLAHRLVSSTLVCLGILASVRLPLLRATQQDAEAARKFIAADGGFAAKLVIAALDRTREVVRYDGAYVKIPYPKGDVPADTGVCTDEVIRSYRAVGYDLQEFVHVDMKAHFKSYPQQWGLPGPDANIDHRRVPNLQTFLKRRGAAVPVTQDTSDYKPGDLVTCTASMGRSQHWPRTADGGSIVRIPTDGTLPLASKMKGVGRPV